MQRVNEDLSIAPGDRATLLAQLKSEDRAQNGLKGDLVAYEIIANAIAEFPRCLARAHSTLHALAQACAGAATPFFEITAAGQVPTLVFRSCP